MKTKTTILALAAAMLTAFSVNAHELSARGYVGTGDNVLIGGIIIEDNDCPLNGKYDENGKEQRDAVTFVIRVLGPSLGKYGVPDCLQDPELAFYDFLGRSLGGESNYTQVDTETQQKIYDHGLAPVDYREVVLVVKILPGFYTAVVTGAGGTTGNALLEAYKIQ